jgi:hypothetical protein
MDLVATIEGPAGPSENFTKHEKLLEDAYRSPERKQGNFSSVFSAPSSLDIYSLGQLIRTLFKGRETQLDPKLQQLVVLMANANPTMRPTPEQLLATNSFDHPLLKDIQFMEELHLKVRVALYSHCAHTVLTLCSYCAHTVLTLYSHCAQTVLILHLKPPEELKAFFQAFVGRIEAIPKGVLEHKLLPCLTQVCLQRSSAVVAGVVQYVNGRLTSAPPPSTRFCKIMLAGAST